MIAQPKLPVKVLIALRQQKSTGKQSVPFFGEAVYCIQHELHKRVACTLCSFAVATYTRHVETKKGKLARIELYIKLQPTRGTWRQRIRLSFIVFLNRESQPTSGA